MSSSLEHTFPAAEGMSRKWAIDLLLTVEQRRNRVFSQIEFLPRCILDYGASAGMPQGGVSQVTEKKALPPPLWMQAQKPGAQRYY
ncbi:MAG: hypothetical protein WBQ89_08325 [Candidatus Acidiferrum sp.]